MRSAARRWTWQNCAVRKRRRSPTSLTSARPPPRSRDRALARSLAGCGKVIPDDRRGGQTGRGRGRGGGRRSLSGLSRINRPTIKAGRRPQAATPAMVTIVPGMARASRRSVGRSVGQAIHTHSCTAVNSTRRRLWFVSWRQIVYTTSRLPGHRHRQSGIVCDVRRSSITSRVHTARIQYMN